MILGITGEKRSGKDTVAQYLVGAHNFRRKALADPIRRMCKDIFGWSEEWIENHKEETDPQWGISYRQAAQYIGTDLFRVRLPELAKQYAEVTADSIWVKHLLMSIDFGHDWVIPDVRFPNESGAIRENGGYIIRIQRDARGVGPDDHASEAYYDELTTDYTIVNDKTLEHLYRSVDRVYAAIRGWI